MSIYKKIVLIAGLILVMTTGIRTVMSVRFFNRVYTRALESRALAIGEILKFQLERLFALGIPLEELVGFDEQCRALIEQHNDIKTAMVIDLRGGIIFHSDRSIQNTAAGDVNILRYLAEKEYSPRVIMDKAENDYDAIIPVKNLQAVLQGFIVVEYSSKALGRNIRRMAAGSIVVTLISLVVAMILLFLSINFWVNKPLMKLMVAIQKIKKEGINFKGKVEINSKDEFGALAVSFNQMIEDLQKVTVSRDELIREVNMRKKAEGEIRKFKTISDRAGYGVAIVDTQGIFLYINEAFARMHGYAQDQLIGRNLSILFPEEQLKNLNKFTEALKKQGSFTAEELWHKRKDGGLFPVLMNATVIQDEQGMPLFLSVVAVDSTDRKKAEERQGLLLKDLEDINRIMVGRELKMIELKKEINRLNQELGRPLPYDEVSLG